MKMETTNESGPIKPGTEYGDPPPKRYAYLIAHIDGKTLRVVGVRTYSEPPWLLTRMGSKAGREILAVLMEAHDVTYADAVDQLRAAYVEYEPELAERFPIPPWDKTSGVAVAVPDDEDDGA